MTSSHPTLHQHDHKMRQLNADEYTSIVLGVEMLMHLVARNYCMEGVAQVGTKAVVF